MSPEEIVNEPPERPSAESMLKTIRKALMPPLIRFSAAVEPGKAYRFDDEDRKVVYCSFVDREKILASLGDDDQYEVES